MSSAVLAADRVAAAMRTVGATELFVFTGVAPGRLELRDGDVRGVRRELRLDDEPLARQALDRGLRRVASPDARPVCAGYTARSAALVAVAPDVLVVLGRRDGCLAGVSDAVLHAAAAAVVAAR